MIVYIAGPITGIFDYRKKFKKVEEVLTEMGHVALNPAILPYGLKHYMPTCIAMLDQADAICLLKGWEDSLGAKEELAHARNTGKQLYWEEDIIEDN